MHTINVHREEIEGCWEVSVDGRPTSASPSKRIIGEVVLDALQRLGEATLISCTDSGPENREKRNRSLAQRVGREAANRVREARAR